MKQKFLKVCALFLAVIIVVCAAPYVRVEAATTTAGGYGTQPSTYSKQYNSGTRDIWCTTLSGTSASSYYTGSYTYDNLSELSQSSLKSSLATLMKSTHSYTSSYDDCHYKADRTDCENGDKRVTLIYTSYSATMSQWNGWNREHVWPQSLGGNNTRGGGADLHHIRPSDAGVNSSRGNKKYGESGSGATSKFGTDPAVGVLGGTYNSTYFEPLDNVKGDVARICLYVHVRWGSDWGASSITSVFQSVDVLLEWMEIDPVDTWEMGRNEVVQDIQGNRNVFIDYPEYAWMIFGREVPDDMVTPSGEAMDGNTGGGTTTTEKPTETESETPSGSGSTGTLASPLTVTQAYEANKGLAEGGYSSEKFYVRGKVTSIGTTGSYYQNVKVTDGETELLIYSINFGNGIDSFEVGDTITAYGYFKNYYGTIEMAGNNGDYPEVVAKGEAVTDAPTEKPTEKPTEAPTDAPIVPPVISGETVENTLSFADKAQRTEFDSDHQVWMQNGITLINNKASSQTKVADYADPVRLYQGSSVTIQCENIVKLVVECNTAAYANVLVTSLSDVGINAAANGKTVTAELTGAVDEITFTCSAQMRFNSLTVTSVVEAETETPTEPPAETDEPTEAPVVTDEPTEAPVVTDEPTEAPVVTDEPTEAPVVTDEPTEAPVETDAPTEAPVVTDEPTELPVVTDEPTESETPTEPPVETDEPTESETPTEPPVETDEPTESETTTEEPDEETRVMSHDEYLAAEDGDTVIVEAYVQGATVYSEKYSDVSLYLADRDGAYYVYRYACSGDVAARLTVGTKVRVEGIKQTWQGEIEIVNPKVDVIDGADTYIAEPADLTDILANEGELIKYQNSLAIFKGLTVGSVDYKYGAPGDDIFVTVKQGDKSFEFIVERDLVDPESEVYKAFTALESGDEVDITGFVYWHNGVNTNITDVKVIEPEEETTAAPTDAPTSAPTEAPTETPTEEPTVETTEAPTVAPTEAPTAAPTEEPTVEPTEAPTVAPTETPTAAPTEEPTVEPTEAPTVEPTEEPTVAPTEAPTSEPTEEPTVAPTEEPTDAPTEAPTAEPTDAPTEAPTSEPTDAPTLAPTDKPTEAPTDDGGDKAGCESSMAGGAAVISVIFVAAYAFIRKKKED